MTLDQHETLGVKTRKHSANTIWMDTITCVQITHTEFAQNMLTVNYNISENAENAEQFFVLKLIYHKSIIYNKLMFVYLLFLTFTNIEPNPITLIMHPSQPRFVDTFSTSLNNY